MNDSATCDDLLQLAARSLTGHYRLRLVRNIVARKV